MILAAPLAAQLAHPRGLTGRLLGQVMDLVNQGPIRLAVDKLAPESGERILDAGCGTGAALAEVSARADCTLHGVDKSRSMVAMARRRLSGRATVCVQDIADIPDAWAPFDGALALNVLYFADATCRMISGLRRPLREGGRLVAYVTHRKTMERWPFIRAGVHRLYDAHELEDALVAGGFRRTLISIEEHVIAKGVRGLIARAERGAITV